MTLFVAAFLGSPAMNLWHVRVVEREGRVVLLGGDQRLVVPEAVLRRRAGLRSHVGRDLVLGLRPESIATGEDRPGRCRLELPVAFVEELGSHQLVHLRAEGAGLQPADSGASLHDADRIDAAAFVRPTETLIASVPARVRVDPGQRLRVHVDLERAHFFDPATQYALP